MGHGHSNEGRYCSSKEDLSHELAIMFAKRCFTSLELYYFEEIFKSLAEHQSRDVFIKENTLVRFLEIPDILGVSPVIFRMISYLGAFPFCQDAPAILGFDQMILVVSLTTQRYQKVLRKEVRDYFNLLFYSLAVYDRQEFLDVSKNAKSNYPATESDRNLSSSYTNGVAEGSSNFFRSEQGNNNLALAALKLLNDTAHIHEIGDASNSEPSIPPDNLKKLIMLLLFVAPLEGQDSLAQHASRLVDTQLERLRKTADNILGAFVNVETSPGVKLHQFHATLTNSLPFLFDALCPLFEHLLFVKKTESIVRDNDAAPSHLLCSDPLKSSPILPQDGEILDLNLLSQLSFFLPGSSLFRRLRLLYSGGDSGFSMGSFETHVMNWRAPTILLVSGTRITEPPTSGRERAFANTISPKRFPDSNSMSRLVFGVYLSQPWRQTHKECFGNTDTILFQLEPTHEVFRASTINTDYATFTKVPSSHQGITFGCPPITTKQLSGVPAHVNLGSVSLLLDSSFEFGVFTHNFSLGGGAFCNSETRKYNWQDRFEIDSLEVWGCGGDAEAEQQRIRWEWEEREAEARRRVNLGTGDIESDRALLEMAGIIDSNRSGGSMN
ncbi:BgTH12-03780 [Blumeria graminis f. sp. triticale]|uniref:Restriction of telomere capping protein 5 n=1 Tax=Blumeria graminis f. sp. triticale TaxID=1689686 RepID=A0A9W4GBN5_BLUGR|nr:BgTH12-03780 [Blumeria graminis f. sp. triticale]